MAASAASLACLFLGIAAARAGDGPALPRAPRPEPSKGGSATVASKAADCAACHVESGWAEVKFAHERTGFPLRDAHAKVACRSCHPSYSKPSDFRARVADSCGGCHRDRHRGELGQRCEGCHDERSWRHIRKLLRNSA